MGMSLQLEPELFLDLASRVHRLKLYPYFDVAHYALMCITVRDDLATGAVLFSRKPPAVMLVVMYLVFYSPFDLVYKIGKLLPFKVVLCVGKEVARAHKIQTGVNHAAKIYPNAFIIMVIIGTLKGAGDGIMRTLEQLVRGVWVPTGNELLRPSFATKASILVSILLVVEKKTTFISAPHELIYLAIVGFLIYFKLSALFLGIIDPLLPFENFFCAIFMGGVWDALSRAIAASRERRAAAVQENGHIPEKKEQ